MTFDVAIVGGGPVGLALGLACPSLSVALIAKAAPRPGAAPGADAFEPRVYAISPGNVEFLREAGVWPDLPAERVTPIFAMEVYGDRNERALVFDAYRAGTPALAWTVEDGVLQRTLWSRLSAAPHVTTFAPAEPQGLASSAQLIRVALSTGAEVQAELAVGADGARSFVRRAAGIGTREHPYGQTAVVANFACERAHRNVALQWFQGGPVLALLPLPGERVSMIWSLPQHEAEKLLALDEAALSRRVEAGSYGRLGALRLLGAPVSYALRRLSATRMTAQRVALAGDAARVIHPLAGQGLNLGLQDVRVLARVLASRAPGQSTGDEPLMRRYERRSAERALLMQGAVDGLFALFGARNDALAGLRNHGLNLVARVPVLRNLLVRHAMQ